MIVNVSIEEGIVTLNFTELVSANNLQSSFFSPTLFMP